MRCHGRIRTSSISTCHPPVRNPWIILTGLFAVAGAAVWIVRQDRAYWRSVPTHVRSSEMGSSDMASAGPASARVGSEAPLSTAVAPGPMHFTDVTRNSGVDFMHVSGDSAEKPFPAANGSGVGAFDFDLDGQVDLYFLTGTDLLALATLPAPATRSTTDLHADRIRSGPVNRCYRNLGDWQFRDVTGPAGLGDSGFSAGIAIGDFDSDGFPDVFINNFGPHRLYRNAGDGTFFEAGAAAGVDADAWGTSAAFLDYDGDGLLDLYVCHYALWTLETNRYCGDQARGVRIFCNPNSVEPAPHILFHNEGDGRFVNASKETGIGDARGRGQGVVAADVNGDGRTDLYVTNDLNPNLLFLNMGNGRFSEAGQESGTATDFMGRVQAGMGVDAADLNRDGRIDLFVTNYEGEHNSFYENLGDNLFQEVSRTRGLAAESIPWVGWGAALADFDHDGWPDVVVTNGHTDDNLQQMGRDSPYAQPPGLWHNVQGRFTYVGGAAAGEYFGQSHVGRGLATADLDNDGDLDVVITHQNATAALLRNDNLPNLKRSWIRVQLIGTASNRDAVGAEISLTADGATPLVQQVKGGGSYLSANELQQILAVAADASNPKLQIRWPSGRRTEIAVPQGKQQLQVIER